MDFPAYEIRLLREEDIPQVLQLRKENGFDEGRQALYTWSKIDPEAFYVAVNKEGRVLGVCAAVVQHNDLAFVGCYIVRKECRGKGIGVQLWDTCFKHIGERNAAVNAYHEQMKLYMNKGGFPVGESRWTRIVYEVDEDLDTSWLTRSREDIEILQLTDNELPLALEYDYSLMNYNRNEIISLIVNERDSLSFMALRENKCVGYGTIKLSIFGAKMIGPLYADSQDIAEMLLRQLLTSFHKGKGLFFMTLSTNEAARNIAKKLGVVEKGVCSTRSYKEYKLDMDISKVYGQLSSSFAPF